MRPSERRDVRQELRGNAESVALALRDSMAEVKRVPVNDDGGKEVQAGYAEMLAFGGAVADFALTAEDAHHLDAIVAYFASGRFGVEISREETVRVAVRELAERCRPDRIINDCGLTEAERRVRA